MGGRIAIVLVVVLGILTLIGLPFGITLWAWVKLLIVPAVIAAGGLWFNRQQRDREMEIAEQHSQDEVLQAYLDGMSQLLTDKERPLYKAQPGDSLSTVTRARTLTVLRRLNDERKASVLLFLYEAQLIANELPIVALVGADLTGAPLWGANLNEANQQGAYLRGVNLSGANLNQANLRGANLTKTDLSGAMLRGAILVGNTGLGVIDLSYADLSGAEGITMEEVEYVARGATMPSGQKYDNWLKSKGRGEDGPKTGTS